MSTEQIKSLLQEAAQAGDDAQVALCKAALAGDDAAWCECEQTIRETEGRAS